MIRLPDEKSCFLSNSTDYVPKPADLVKLLVSAREWLTYSITYQLT